MTFLTNEEEKIFYNSQDVMLQKIQLNIWEYILLDKMIQYIKKITR